MHDTSYASLPSLSARSWAMPQLTRQQKITFAEMRAAGVSSLLITDAAPRTPVNQTN
jgi:hypothetical protein